MLGVLFEKVYVFVSNVAKSWADKENYFDHFSFLLKILTVLVT